MEEQGIDKKAAEAVRAREYLLDITAAGDERKYRRIEEKMREEYDKGDQKSTFGQYMIDQVHAIEEDPETARKWERLVESDLQRALEEKRVEREYQKREQERIKATHEFEKARKEEEKQVHREEMKRKSGLWQRIEGGQQEL